ncbi:MAG TPA: histidine--tRNA ligase [Candidatus Eremiobacteraceae bacterium]|nr:histidine--tRNA ligase [Candidatus Eremiobacteraceae bacterium]
MKNFSAPRGTFDILPPGSKRWQALERRIDDVCSRFGYGEIRTPMFESTEVFVRTLGETTDVVDKEMYTFVDRGGRSLTLRPELTAPAVRAVLEHDLLRTPPVKLYYRGAFFRYERPQKGRFRQAHQFGVECFGVEGPEADAEVIALALEIIRASGIAEVTLEVNSMGCPTCRADYRNALVAYLDAHRDALSETSRDRLARNPLRILDSKDPSDKMLVAAGPKIGDYLCDACRAHFDGVLALLDAMHIAWRRNPLIVRGFDYYTRTVFEFSSEALGSQNAICGGGRYDGLVESMGGPPTPGVGFGMGMDRLLIVAQSSERATDGLASRSGIDVAFIALDPDSTLLLVPPMYALRKRGVAVDMDYTRRKLEKQLRAAGDAGARFAAIVGEDERKAGDATVQDLSTRERERVKLVDLEAALLGRLGK